MNANFYNPSGLIFDEPAKETTALLNSCGIQTPKVMKTPTLTDVREMEILIGLLHPSKPPVLPASPMYDSMEIVRDRAAHSIEVRSEEHMRQLLSQRPVTDRDRVRDLEQENALLKHRLALAGAENAATAGPQKENLESLLQLSIEMENGKRGK